MADEQPVPSVEEELRARFSLLFLERRPLAEPDYAVIVSLLNKAYPPDPKAAAKAEAEQKAGAEKIAAAAAAKPTPQPQPTRPAGR